MARLGNLVDQRRRQHLYRMRVLLSTLSLLGILVGGLTSLPAAAQSVGRNETVVTRGDVVPDANGTFFGFNDPFLNDSGDVSFRSILTGTSGGSTDDTGLFVIPQVGAPVQVVREGQAAPDADGTHSSFVNFGLNESGQVLFYSGFIGTSGGIADDSGLFRGTGGALTTIGREGDTVPGGNGEYGQFSAQANTTGFNASGQASYRNVLVNTSGGLTDDQAVFRSDGFATEVVREGDAAPGGIGNFSDFSNSVKINDSNQVAFVGNVGLINGVYRADSTTSYVPIFVEGDVAPDGNGTLAFVQGFLTMNNSGQVAIEASMTGTALGGQDNEGLYRGDGASRVQIMRENNPVPGGNGVFQNLQSTTVRMNQSGQVAFSSALRDTAGGTADDSALYRSSTSGFFLTEIAREGDGISTGDGLLGSLGSAQPALNDSGHVTFIANLTGTSNNSGVFIGDGEELVTVVQEGQSLGGSTVATLEFEGGEGHRSGLNNLGQVVYRANLANLTSVVQTWTPELHWRRMFSSDWDVSSNWTLGTDPANVHDVFIDPDGSLTVDVDQEVSAKSLQVGGGNGIATLRLQIGRSVTTSNGITIESTGIATGDGSLHDNVTNMGTIQAQNVLVTGTLTNDGVIRGNGRLDAPIVNNAAGNIRANNGDALQLTGASLSNAGRIEVIGGELEVTANVQNVASTGLITGRDATMRFNGGLSNDGSIGISVGTTDIFGEITNNASGTINVSGGATATFYDDVAQNGTLQIVSVGNTNSVAVFFGDLSGGGFTGGGDVFALGDLRPGFSPASVLMDGNLFLGASTTAEFEFEGDLIGEFDQLVVTGDLSLSGSLDVATLGGFEFGSADEFIIADVAGTLSGEFAGLGEGDLVGEFGGQDLFISYVAGDGNDVALFTGLNGDFDLDNDVDGADFLAWQRGLGSAFDASDLDDWQANFGTDAGSLAASSTTIPEPSTCWLLLGLVAIGATTRNLTTLMK